MPKRFWVFAGADYYPSGGMDDSHWSFDTQAEAEAMACDLATNPKKYDERWGVDWVQVWDLETDVELLSISISTYNAERKREVTERRP